MKVTPLEIIETATKIEEEAKRDQQGRINRTCQIIDFHLKKAAVALIRGAVIEISFPSDCCGTAADLALVVEEVRKKGFWVASSSTGYPDDDATIRIGLIKKPENVTK